MKTAGHPDIDELRIQAGSDTGITAPADLFAKAVATVRPHQFFHDRTVTSSGLLTNLATGGWRKDLSAHRKLGQPTLERSPVVRPHVRHQIIRFPMKAQ